MFKKCLALLILLGASSSFASVTFESPSADNIVVVITHVNTWPSSDVVEGLDANNMKRIIINGGGHSYAYMTSSQAFLSGYYLPVGEDQKLDLALRSTKKEGCTAELTFNRAGVLQKVKTSCDPLASL